MDKKRAKRAYLSKLRKMVSSHVYDLGKKIIDEGVENAQENHEVKLGVHKSMKDIAKEVVQLNTKVKNYVKATRDEVQSVLKEGTKQAIVAIKNDKGSMKSDMDDDDEFFKSLDIDLDDLDSDDWDDIMDGDSSDDDDDSDDDIGNESMFDGAKEWAEKHSTEGKPLVVSKITDDEISAAIALLISKVEYPEFKEVYEGHYDEILNAIKLSKSPLVDEIKEGEGDKLNLVKTMINEVNSDMVPNVGTENDTVDPELENAPIVVEVIETELPTAVPESKNSLQVKAALNKGIVNYLKTVENIINRDDEIIGILNLAESKMDAVANYVSSWSGKSVISIQDMIANTLVDMIPGIRGTVVGPRVLVAFYLGIIPFDLVTMGERIVSIYYNKVKNS